MCEKWIFLSEPHNQHHHYDPHQWEPARPQFDKNPPSLCCTVLPQPGRQWDFYGFADESTICEPIYFNGQK